MSYYKIRPRGGTASQWTAANPILAEREIGFEYPAGGLGTGLVKMKMGDGTTHWNDLPYATVSPVVENVESTSQENVPSSNYLKGKLDEINAKLNVKTIQVTGTTNSAGAISLGLAQNTTEIVMIKSSSSSHRVQAVAIGGTSLYGIITADQASYSPVANTSVTLTVKYREI
ncbi:MAG: hypothetical protein J6W10_09745 [Kiritimatiellae bacterium]|nr:hypothetical protein [Kiritimatiellia bacterium]